MYSCESNNADCERTIPVAVFNELNDWRNENDPMLDLYVCCPVCARGYDPLQTRDGYAVARIPDEE